MVDAVYGSGPGRAWWAMGLRGLIALVLGIMAFLLPGAALTALVLTLAVYLLVDGVLALVGGIRALGHHRRWWAMVLEGLLDLAAAGIVLLWPGLSLLGLVWILAVWAIVTGVAALVAASVLPLPHGRIPQVLAGLVSIGLGIAMIALPAAGVLALAWWIAAYAIAFGVFQLGLALQLYRHSRRRVPAQI